MQVIVPALTTAHCIFIKNREKITQQWVSYEGPKNILILHGIEEKFFLKKYASGVFDYFMDIIKGKVEIGHCPVMQELLTYLKKREISADELFEICSHFRRSMIDFSYDAKLNSKSLFDEISFIFDKNFKGILKFYTDTIFQKLIDARQDALRASQAKEYFLSNMSHEIRTPLNAILGFVNLLLEEEISKKHRNYLDIIHNSGENLLSIINDILDFSKLRSGEFTLENKNFSLHEEISHTMELFVASANAKDITITSFIDPNIPIELYGDALRIKQILSNFLSNAIKFTPESGVLKVEASYANSTLIVSVEDNGIGICQEDIKKIFKAFAQAEYNIQENKGGTGLGLSISHQLAQKMGGEVGVASKVTVGSKFWMKIPMSTLSQQTRFFDDIDEFKKLKMVIYAQENKVNYKHESYLQYAEMFKMDIRVVDSLETEFDTCIFVHEDVDKMFLEKIKKLDKKFLALMSKEHDDYENYPHITALSFPIYCSKIYEAFHELLNPEEHSMFKTTISQKYKGHVLVAEDNEANQELIKIILSKYGLSFDIANNGLEAFDLYRVNKYDLILMDEQMPIMNGNEAVENIIAYEANKSIRHTPISALTANVVKGARERGLFRGFDAFLGKPIVLKELEKLFVTYLKVDNEKKIQEIQEKKRERFQIVGLDTEKLMKALMLNSDELLMLLKLFMKKMDKILPELQRAIEERTYKEIAMIAHSIKGSSGNFRMKEVQEFSSQIEDMAREENKEFNYANAYEEIEKIIDSINIE